MRFNGIIIDMDGTLLDTLEDLANSMNKVLKALGYPVHPVEAYRYFTGDGMEMLARRVLPGGCECEETVKRCMEEMDKEYNLHCRENTKLYPGIRELLDWLEDKRVPKAVLSNKPDGFTKAMAKEYLSEWTFSEIRGEGPSTPRKPDPAAALEIAAGMGLEPGRILYLGDSRIDMQTAARAGMYAVGALWGFRTAKELTENGAGILVETPKDVIPIMVGG
jgi:phosphoglycolate phosphatase